MTLGAHLRTVLLEFSPLADKIGDKFAPVINEIDAVLPFVLYMETDTDPISDFGGETGECFTTVEVQVLSAELDEAREIGKLIWHVLKKYKGDCAGVKIKDIQRLNDVDGGWDEEDEAFRRILTLRVFHTDPAPVILD